MQKLLEMLQKYGVEIPEEKQTEIKSELSKGYKNIAEHNKALGKVEADRDTWKTKAETAEETLKTFEGIDPAKINDELATYKKKAEDAERAAEQKIYQRDYRDALNTAMEAYEFTSDAAKRSVMASIEAEGLKLKDGMIMGLNDYVKQLQDADPNAFVNKEQKELEKNRSKFTIPGGGSGGGAGLTKSDILKIKDPVERQNAIAQNLGLFGKE